MKTIHPIAKKLGKFQFRAMDRASMFAVDYAGCELLLDMKHGLPNLVATIFSRVDKTSVPQHADHGKSLAQTIRCACSLMVRQLYATCPSCLGRQGAAGCTNVYRAHHKVRGWVGNPKP